MKYRALITMFFVLLTIGAFAGTRTKEEMKEAAISVLMNSSAARGMTKSTHSSDLKEYLTKDKLSIIGSEDLGFAVVTSDDRFKAIIGYSESPFIDSMPCGFKWWIDEVETIMEDANVQPIISKSVQLTPKSSVAPLLTTEWGQDNPYNALLKYKINNVSYQFMTGCVATAMAQVMKYYKYPEKGMGSIEYVVENYNARMSHTFEDTYDWDNMLDEYNYQVSGNLDVRAKAVSTLMRDCGMAVKTNFGTKSSGAYFKDIVPGLTTYFGYDGNGTKQYVRSDYQKEEWMRMIYNELSEYHPIIYSGKDAKESSGHSFVLHGYDSSGLIFINWGWKGYHDGYYDMDLLSPDKYTYSDNQCMIFVRPGEQSTVIDDHCKIWLTASGSGVVYYENTNNMVKGTTKTYETIKSTTITLIFSPNTGCKVGSVKVNNVNITTGITSNTYSIKIEENTTIEVTFTEGGNIDNQLDGHEFVDLGLSSRKLWSVVNYGASRPEDSGTYYSSSSFTSTRWGNSWTTPSIEDFQELIDQCEWTWTTLNGTNGYLVKGKNGKTMFLPASGYLDDISSILGGGATGKGTTIYCGTSSKSSDFIPREMVLIANTSEIAFQQAGFSIEKYPIRPISTIVNDNGTEYTLNIISSGQGKVSYDGIDIRDNSKEFKLKEGTSATITFTPNSGYQIGSVKVNNTDVTSSVSNNKFTINNIQKNTTVSVTFEVIPPITYSLSITSSGSGYVSFSGNTVKGTTKTYTVNEGTSAILTFTPDNGCRIGNVRVNNVDVTSSISNNQYTINNINNNLTVSVSFEAIPLTTYTLSITSSENGTVSYMGTNISGTTKTFTVSEGTSATLQLSQNMGYSIRRVTVNDVDETSSVQNGQYTINNIRRNTNVIVKFEDYDVEINGIYYILDKNNRTAEVTYRSQNPIGKSYSGSVNVPQSITYNGITYSISSIGELAFKDCWGVTSVTIPNSVTTIGKSALSITDITSVTIPNSVKSIGWRAFDGCSDLKDVKSEITSPFAIDTNVFGYINKNAVLQVPQGTKSKYQALSGWTANFKEIVEYGGTTSYTLSITSSGYGYVTYSGTTIKGTTKTFTVDENASATITITPDNGYRIKSVMMNGTVVTSQLSRNQFVINAITTDTDITVTFEAEAPSIDITKYISVSSAGGAIMQTNDLINYGSQLSWRFSNRSEVDVTLKSMQLIDGKTGQAGNIMSVNTIVEAGQAVGYTTTIGLLGIHTPVTCRFRYEYNGVEYSADAIYKSMYEYELTINVTGNGSVTYNGSTIRNSSKSVIVDRYDSATLSFAPDEGYRIKSVIVNGSDVTSSVANNKYTISSISKDTNIKVEFEAIPPSYTLSIKASGNGSVIYDNNTIRSKTSTFSVEEGTAVTLSISPDLGHKMNMVTENGSDVSSKVKDGKYEIGSMSKNTTIEVGFVADIYKLIYMVDGVEYKTIDVEYGTTITPEAGPTKDGYSFSGWSNLPSTMPAHDVTVTGIFMPNKYKLTYLVDGQTYKTLDVEYGAAITPEAAPTKEGYTFSGWNEVPEKMPNMDVTVTGTFTINKYKLIYLLNGEEYKVYELEYGSAITPEAAPTKEGYTFSGWSWIPTKMPAEDVTITGSLTANKHKLTYMVDGVEFKTFEVDYGSSITPEEEPTKEGYTFNGWSWIPKKMPDEDVTVMGTFTVNKYKLTYMIGNEVYKVVEYDYGATITPEGKPEGDYVTFVWKDVPETMPAKDVTVYADYETGIAEVLMAQGIKYIYAPNGKRIEKLQKGLNIVVMNDGSVRKVVLK